MAYKKQKQIPADKFELSEKTLRNKIHLFKKLTVDKQRKIYRMNIRYKIMLFLNICKISVKNAIIFLSLIFQFKNLFIFIDIHFSHIFFNYLTINKNILHYYIYYKCKIFLLK